MKVWVAGSKVAPVGRLLALKVRASPSGSLPVTVNWKSCPSFTVLEPMGLSTGERFTFPTVMVIASEAFCGGVPLSVTVKRTLG